MDTAQYNELVNLLVNYLKIAIPIFLIVLIVQIVAMWKLFSKAGEAGWKALIPIYNLYIYYKIARIPNLYWLYLLLTVISVIPNQIVVYISLIGIVAITIYHSYKLSTAYGHGVGYTFGLLFLNTIFLLILGFGSSEYKLEK